MKVFLIAGEPSGDRLAAALMAGLRDLCSDIEFIGVAGPLMQAQGMDSLFDMSELSVMGLAEVLPKYRHLKRRITQTADAVVAAQPHVLITVDSPDFSLRVARLVKDQSDIRTVHYVAPTVWAWRPGRAAKMAKMIDHVLALFPFEPPYMEAEGMACDFVGHPIVAERAVTDAEVAQLRAEHNIDGPTLVVLPGSRKGEVSRMMDVFAETLRDDRFEGHTLLFPTLPHLVPILQPYLDRLAQKYVLIDGQGLTANDAAHLRQTALTAANFALAASGTISLELARAQTPMVIAYDMNWLSRQIIGRMLTTDTVTLVNLVSDTRTVPEFIGANCQPDLIADGLMQLMADPSSQRDASELTMQRLGLGQEAPGLRAARAVLKRL
ncbi:MAG: lipid-A-disaccharide synthase [Planktomarina sp.]